MGIWLKTAEPDVEDTDFAAALERFAEDMGRHEEAGPIQPLHLTAAAMVSDMA